MDSFWTAERVLELRALWVKGDSAGLIAQAMTVTRNAVLGKVHRLKLEKRSNRNGFFHGPDRETVKRTPPQRNAPLRVYRQSVFKAPDSKPAFHAPNPNARPGLIATMSPITGAFLNVKRRLPMQAEMTKDQLRAVLTQAVINTAALVVA